MAYHKDTKAKSLEFTLKCEVNFCPEGGYCVISSKDGYRSEFLISDVDVSYLSAFIQCAKEKAIILATETPPNANDDD